MLNPDDGRKRNQPSTAGTRAAFHTQASGVYTPLEPAGLI